MLEVSSVFKPSIDFGRFFPIDPDLLSRQTMKSVTITPQNTAAAYFSNVRGWRFSEMTGSVAQLPADQETSPQQAYLRFLCSKAGRWTHRKVRPAQAAFSVDGFDCPLSQRDTACRETFSFAATSACVSPAAFRACVSFSQSVISFSPDFMGYRDFCKPKIGCFLRKYWLLCRFFDSPSKIQFT